MDRQDRDKTPKKGLWSSLAKPFKKTPKERPELPWGSNYVPADPYRPHGPQLAPRPTTAPGFSYFREPRGHGANVRPGDATRLPEKQVSSSSSSGASFHYRGVDSHPVPFPRPRHGYASHAHHRPQSGPQERPRETPQRSPQGARFPQGQEGVPSYAHKLARSHTERPEKSSQGTQLPEVQEWVRSYTKGPQSSPRDDLKLPQNQERVRRYADRWVRNFTQRPESGPQTAAQLPEVQEWVRGYTDQPSRNTQAAPRSRGDNKKDGDEDPFADFSWYGFVEEDRSQNQGARSRHPREASRPQSSSVKRR